MLRGMERRPGVFDTLMRVQRGFSPRSATVPAVLQGSLQYLKLVPLENCEPGNISVFQPAYGICVVVTQPMFAGLVHP